jgi:hypothetical protein
LDDQDQHRHGLARPAVTRPPGLPVAKAKEAHSCGCDEIDVRIDLHEFGQT